MEIKFINYCISVPVPYHSLTCNGFLALGAQCPSLGVVVYFAVGLPLVVVVISARELLATHLIRRDKTSNTKCQQITPSDDTHTAEILTFKMNYAHNIAQF